MNANYDMMMHLVIFFGGWGWGVILEFLDWFDNIEHLCIFSIKIRIPLHHHLFSNFKNVVIFEGIAKIHQNWQPIKKNLL